MVAHTATSRDPSWRSEPSPLVPLLPPPSLADKILDDLSSPHFSLAVVAQMHGLSLAGILAWLNLPETREQLALRESAAYAHTRHVAALNMEHAVQTAASIVRDYNTSRPEREAQDRKTPGSAHRASVHARKAAWLLYRFSRITPVNEADLRHAAGCVPASAKRANGCDVGGHTSANKIAATNVRVPLVPDSDAQRLESEPVRSDSDSQPTTHAAESVQHASEFENQPTIVRRSTRTSAPAPVARAPAALVATGPPHTG